MTTYFLSLVLMVLVWVLCTYFQGNNLTVNLFTTIVSTVLLILSLKLIINSFKKMIKYIRELIRLFKDIVFVHVALYLLKGVSKELKEYILEAMREHTSNLH